jgi:hypothetical protein
MPTAWAPQALMLTKSVSSPPTGLVSPRQPQRSPLTQRSSLRLWLILGLAWMSLLISGCVQSDLVIDFVGQRGGEVRQQIQLTGPLTTFNSRQTQDWLGQIQHQAKHLGGRSQTIAPQTLEITLPFENAQDLAQKLNQYFLPLAQPGHPLQRKKAEGQPLPEINTDLILKEQNFILFVRDRFTYDLDLRSLGLQSVQGDVLLSPDSLFDVSFSLKTPWGSRGITQKNLEDATVNNPGLNRQGRLLTWKLQPGYRNHLDAAFWYPSPVGWGAIAILLLVIVGGYVKSGLS